jgi:catechol 2,3-dioxygenase-like lactoylglutathione lyase family enzyme
MADLSHTIIFVTDMARSVVFYRDVLGLPVRLESDKWTEFETPGCTLALHLADVPGQNGSPCSLRSKKQPCTKTAPRQWQRSYGYVSALGQDTRVRRFSFSR